MQKNRLVYIPQIAHAYHFQIVRAVPFHLRLAFFSKNYCAPIVPPSVKTKLSFSNSLVRICDWWE